MTGHTPPQLRIPSPSASPWQQAANCLALQSKSIEDGSACRASSAATTSPPSRQEAATYKAAGSVRAAGKVGAVSGGPQVRPDSPPTPYRRVRRRHVPARGARRGRRSAEGDAGRPPRLTGSGHVRSEVSERTSSDCRRSPYPLCHASDRQPCSSLPWGGSNLTLVTAQRPTRARGCDLRKCVWRATISRTKPSAEVQAPLT
jgi:hypothetical protein